MRTLRGWERVREQVKIFLPLRVLLLTTKHAISIDETFGLCNRKYSLHFEQKTNTLSIIRNRFLVMSWITSNHHTTVQSSFNVCISWFFKVWVCILKRLLVKHVKGLLIRFLFLSIVEKWSFKNCHLRYTLLTVKNAWLITEFIEQSHELNETFLIKKNFGCVV